MTQHETITGAAVDAVELLESDHRMVEQLFRQLEAATDETVLREIAEKIIRELSVHAVAEEELLYPTARQAIPDGDSLVDESLSEHGELKQVLAELDGRRPDEAGFREGFQRAKELVEHHVSEEEGELFPRLREGLDQEKLMQLGRNLETAKSMAPTRPHPHAPDQPPGNVIAGMAASVVDRARDAVREMRKDGS